MKAGGIYYQAERYVIHESYNNPRLANDIAVLRVRGPITLTERVQAIEYSSEEVPDGIRLQLTGWSSLYVSVSCNNHSEDPKKRNYFCRKTIVHHNCYNSLNWTPFLRRNVWNCGMAVEFIKAIFVHSPKSAKAHAEWIFSAHCEKSRFIICFEWFYNRVFLEVLSFWAIGSLESSILESRKHFLQQGVIQCTHEYLILYTHSHSCGVGFPDVYAKVSYFYDWIKQNAV